MTDTENGGRSNWFAGASCSGGKQRFLWTEFYEAIATTLLDYRNDRTPLIEGIHEIASRVPGLSYLQDRFADGTAGPLRDICPFTAMGTFNRSMTDENRKNIAVEFTKLLDVDVPVPISFEGIPVLNNQRSWFFGFAQKRGDRDIDALWDVFTAAGRFVDSDQSEFRADFAKAYNDATEIVLIFVIPSCSLLIQWRLQDIDHQSINQVQYLTRF